MSTQLEKLTEGKDLSEERTALLAKAIDLGANEVTLTKIVDAPRVANSRTIVLPQNSLQSLSRGRGWCRSTGKGETVWGKRTEKGNYEVGPGHWSVGATDGFSRKKSTAWKVENVQIGDQTWTLAW